MMTYKYTCRKLVANKLHIHEEGVVRCQGCTMLSSQIEWTWVHWCTAKPTHLATLVLSIPPPPRSLLSAIFTFPSATYFLSPCLLFSSCPPPALIPSNHSLLFEFASCLWYFARTSFLFISRWDTIEESKTARNVQLLMCQWLLYGTIPSIWKCF